MADHYRSPDEQSTQRFDPEHPYQGPLYDGRAGANGQVLEPGNGRIGRAHQRTDLGPARIVPTSRHDTSGNRRALLGWAAAATLGIGAVMLALGLGSSRSGEANSTTQPSAAGQSVGARACQFIVPAYLAGTRETFTFSGLDIQMNGATDTVDAVAAEEPADFNFAGVQVGQRFGLPVSDCSALESSLYAPDLVIHTVTTPGSTRSAG